ncbi:MAG: DUF1592 domain-containing protein [Verrucomicrobiales bacterium]|nr:DUF1592 domain-containing protein [Verrucomicrobiales bacterium]
MKTLACWFAVPGLLIVSLRAEPEAILPEKQFAFLEQNCLECHDTLTQKGRVDLEVLPFKIKTIKDAESWQKVLNVINSKEMPPEDKPQPGEKEKADFLASLSETLVVARNILSDSGGVATMRRLSRREYENTIHDLLGIEIDANILPSDKKEESFDTAGSSLYISSDQIENYRKVGVTALSESIKVATSNRQMQTLRIDFEKAKNPAVEKGLAQQVSIQNRFNRWKKQVDLQASLPQNAAIRNAIHAENRGKNQWEFYRSWKKITGAPSPLEFGFTDASDALHHRSQWEWLMPPLLSYSTYPHRDQGVYLTTDGHAVLNNHFHVPGHWLPGHYQIKFKVARVGEQLLPSSRRDLEDFPLPAADSSRCFLDLDSFQGRFTYGTFQVNGTFEDPGTIEVDVIKRPSDSLGFTLRERGSSEGRVKSLNRESLQSTGVPKGPAIWVESVEMTGPYISDDERKSLDRLQQWVARLEKDEAEVRKIIEEFATVARRGRAPSTEFIDQLVVLFEEFREKGAAPRAALSETLAIVLASPGFLYLAEKPSPSEEITDIELASRLSYFLTGGPPDERLLEAAASGRLKEPASLKAHTQRLLQSPERDRFVVPFLEQWLRLDRLDFFQFNTEKHRDFTLGVKKASRQEIYETFAHWLETNGSLGNLLDSNTIVINALLADLYAIPGVDGDHFRPVKVAAGSPRGGLLGMAAINAKGSNGEDTSPVERGAWVLRKLMNNPPPPAPPNIPQLSRLEELKLSTRELVFMHQEEAQCAQCHRKIDPIGFGLENFNAIGVWRTSDDRKGIAEEKRTIDPSGKIYGGAEFKDYYQLREIISSNYLDDFAHGFTEHLAEFALGRKIGFTDQGMIEEVVATAKEQDYAVPAFIEALVTHEGFRRKR